MRFLSDEWLAELDRLLSEAQPAAAALVIQQVVDERDYFLTLGPDVVSASAGRAATPSVTFTQSRATAWAVFSGAMSAEEAFVRGDIDLQGDVTLLLQHGAAMSVVATHLASLRACTEAPVGA